MESAVYNMVFCIRDLLHLCLFFVVCLCVRTFRRQNSSCWLPADSLSELNFAGEMKSFVPAMQGVQSNTGHGLDSASLVLGLRVLRGRRCGCPEHLPVPSGRPHPCPWGDAPAQRSPWCLPLKGWCNLEPSESQGLAFISAVGTKH